MADERPFNPAAMQSIVDRLKAEGRMPTPEKLRAAMAKARERYQKDVVKARREWDEKHPAEQAARPR